MAKGEKSGGAALEVGTARSLRLPQRGKLPARILSSITRSQARYSISWIATTRAQRAFSLEKWKDIARLHRITCAISPQTGWDAEASD
jgi:hypothetical protein